MLTVILSKPNLQVRITCILYDPIYIYTTIRFTIILCNTVGSVRFGRFGFFGFFGSVGSVGRFGPLARSVQFGQYGQFASVGKVGGNGRKASAIGYPPRPDHARGTLYFILEYGTEDYK